MRLQSEAHARESFLLGLGDDVSQGKGMGTTMQCCKQSLIETKQKLLLPGVKWLEAAGGMCKATGSPPYRDSDIFVPSMIVICRL